MSAAPTIYSLNGKRVWVAGHRGMVGAALERRLSTEDCEIVTIGRDRLDLRSQEPVARWLAEIRPHAIFVSAATVGGILANASYPANFIYDNMMIASNIIHGAYQAGAEKLLFLGSSCIYPRLAPQPISEASLLNGPLEPTNQWYAIAKIAGIKLCQAYRQQHGCDFISAMPSNLYGPGDSFDLETSHVVPALMRKAYEAKLAGADTFGIWGSGSPKREFLYVEDAADALVHVMKTYSDAEPINVGSRSDLSILELAQKVSAAVGFEGNIEADPTKPDGTPRKLMDNSRLNELGWTPSTKLEDGLQKTFEWYRDNLEA